MPKLFRTVEQTVAPGEAARAITDGAVTITEHFGNGSPEGVVTAGPGSKYYDESGGGDWTKASGTGNTGWRRGVRVVVTDTSGGPQTITFDGSDNEMVVYRNSGTNTLAINASAGDAFVGGGSSIVADGDLDTVSLVLSNGEIEVISVSPPTSSSLAAADVKSIYESNNDTNAFTDGEKAKLGSVWPARVSVVDTSIGNVSQEFDGVEGELRVYSNGGASSLTITSPAGVIFTGGGTSIVASSEFDTATLVLSGTEIIIVSANP
ncbi:MAG: hypothetical protein AAGJ40_09700 [Planctomycetota bacterium]